MLASTMLIAALLAAIPKGEWVQIFPGSIGSEVRSDSAHTIYVFPADLARHSDGRWDSISPEAYYGLVLDSRDYWMSRTDYSPGQAPYGVGRLLHFRNGETTSYDTANSCLAGDYYRLLGVDGKGKLLIDQSTSIWSNNATEYKLPRGVIRFDGITCEPISPAFSGTIGASAYARDTLGREYFATSSYGSAYCGDLLRSDKGKLDTLAQGICSTALMAKGAELWVGGGVGDVFMGVRIFSNDGVRSISEINGHAISHLTDILFDSRGIVWLGTSSPIPEENFGLVAISGKDTVIYDKDNSGFPGYASSGLAEDAHGNIWVGAGDGGVAVFARDKSSLALAGPKRPGGIHGGPGKPGISRDLIGRRHRMTSPSFPAPQGFFSRPSR